MCPPAFTVACGDVVLTPSVGYTTVGIFYRGRGIAPVTDSPPLYCLFPVPSEMSVLATVHKHHRKRVRTLIFPQILTPDAHGAGSNRRGRRRSQRADLGHVRARRTRDVGCEPARGSAGRRGQRRSGDLRESRAGAACGAAAADRTAERERHDLYVRDGFRRAHTAVRDLSALLT